jgi:hypothetical protein
MIEEYDTIVAFLDLVAARRGRDVVRKPPENRHSHEAGLAARGAWPMACSKGQDGVVEDPL